MDRLLLKIDATVSAEYRSIGLRQRKQVHTSDNIYVVEELKKMQLNQKFLEPCVTLSTKTTLL